MTSTWLLVIYCALIALGSLAGGWMLMLIRLTHTRLQLVMSCVGGAMLGVGLLHLLPHAALKWKDADPHATVEAVIYPCVWWLVGGFMFMFFVERVFQFHHHDAPGELGTGAAHDRHDHHDHHHGADGPHAAHDPGHEHRLTWGAALIGLSLHSILDGMALAASVKADSDDGVPLAGLVVFLVIFFHKPFDSMTLGALMAVAGRSSRMRHLVNAAFALSIPAGVLIVYLTVGAIESRQDEVVGSALAFAAGTFVCISTSDLLPELQFHSHDRLKLSLALLAGLSLAAIMVLFESKYHVHNHGHANTKAHTGNETGH